MAEDVPAGKNCQVERLFNHCFREQSRTVLVGGATEPLYLPALSSGGLSVLFYREDFVSSALHEVAHWCLAGEQRRKKRDFGYWYLPPNRSPSQQLAFEKVEVKPQALEWIFSLAAGVAFNFSLDNPDSESDSRTTTFEVAVSNQAKHFCRQGLPERAAFFFRALVECFGTNHDRGSIRSRFDGSLK